MSANYGRIPTRARDGSPTKTRREDTHRKRVNTYIERAVIVLALKARFVTYVYIYRIHEYVSLFMDPCLSVCEDLRVNPFYTRVIICSRPGAPKPRTRVHIYIIYFVRLAGRRPKRNQFLTLAHAPNKLRVRPALNYVVLQRTRRRRK